MEVRDGRGHLSSFRQGFLSPFPNTLSASWSFKGFQKGLRSTSQALSWKYSLLPNGLCLRLPRSESLSTLQEGLLDLPNRVFVQST